MSFQPSTHRHKVSASAQARLAPPVRQLSAGPWTAQLVGDELGNLSYAGRPVFRAVKAVVRDQDWRTPQPSLTDVEITDGNDGLYVRWAVKYVGYGVQYDALLTARFTPVSVEISFDGTAAQAFRSNRIGLVVLHPPADAGRDVTVEHPDGTTTAAQFPQDISPHQPLMGIAALEWADAGTAFRLEFTGDVFETEDQRNWTDASFKTYSTPLELPFPVEVAAGDTVRQGVFLEAASLEAQVAAEAPASMLASGGSGKSARLRASLGGAVGHVPALALGAGQHPEALSEIPGLDALLVELVEVQGGASRSAWDAQLQAAGVAAAFHEAGLDIRITTPDPLGAVADLASYLPQAKRLAVFNPASNLTDPETWQEFKAAVRSAGFGGELLAGARSHFTELNRNGGHTPSDSDALTFSITPQMHSTETAHIIDNLPMQRVVAENALRLGGGRPVHVGPVTLLPRFSAVASSGQDAELEADELQWLPFTAAWTLASVSALTMDGVASISYFEASGPRGISDSEGRLNPAGELLKELAALRGNAVLSVDAVAPPGINSPVTLYPVESSAGLMVFAANLSGAGAEVELQLPNGASAIGGESTAFGSGVGSLVGFGADDGEHPTHGRLVLGPWAAGVVRFPASG